MRKSLNTVQDMENTLLQAKLVGCTCLSISHVLFAKRRFDFCIVDEASQITQPVVLGALRFADTFALVGDHYQVDYMLYITHLVLLCLHFIQFVAPTAGDKL